MNAIITTSEGRAGHSGHEAAGGFAPPVDFTMPVPPSVNQLFRNVPGRGRVKTGVYDNWRAHAVTQIRILKLRSIDGPVVARFGIERMSKKSDIDNRIKAMFDAIVEAGLIADDSMVSGFVAAWLPAANGYAHVTLWPAQPLTLEFHPSADRATGGWFTAPLQQGEA